MNTKILPENYPQVNISNEIAVAAGLGAQTEHDLFRAESLLSLLPTPSHTAAPPALDPDQRQAVLTTIVEMVSAARNTASAIEVLAD